MRTQCAAHILPRLQPRSNCTMFDECLLRQRIRAASGGCAMIPSLSLDSLHPNGEVSQDRPARAALARPRYRCMYQPPIYKSPRLEHTTCFCPRHSCMLRWMLLDLFSETSGLIAQQACWVWASARDFSFGTRHPHQRPLNIASSSLPASQAFSQLLHGSRSTVDN